MAYLAYTVGNPALFVAVLLVLCLTALSTVITQVTCVEQNLNSYN